MEMFAVSLSQQSITFDLFVKVQEAVIKPLPERGGLFSIHCLVFFLFLLFFFGCIGGATTFACKSQERR